MYAVLGATGDVGGAVADTLLAAGEQVLAVVHDAARADGLRNRGAKVAAIDVSDANALRDALRGYRRAFLLNPPADPATDTDATERATAAAIAAALPDAGLEKVIVASTYGAQPGEALGDLSVLYAFEEQVRATGVPAAINRGAYYLTNFDAALPEIRGGRLTSLYPADPQIPMVSPIDLGGVATERLRSPVDDQGVRHVEGPRPYSHADVAAAFARALGRPVEVVEVAHPDGEAHFGRLGYSPEAARAYARMTATSLNGFERPADPVRGSISLEAHIAALVGR